MEYEDVLNRSEFGLSPEEIGDVLDYLCSVGNLHDVYSLWRLFLRDPRGDMVLELAVTAGCEYIITFNERDFRGIETCHVKAVRPNEFLKNIKENP